jgi:L-ascorbate metabolism protein UlaG (beta-lactamase superfamily)
MTEVTLTHVGGPTVLIEFGGWRILTDPTFDPAGGHYKFGWGTSSRKTSGPAIPSRGQVPAPLDRARTHPEPAGLGCSTDSNWAGACVGRWTNY